MAGLGEALISVGADVSNFEDDLANALENALSKNKFVGIMATSAAAGVAAVIKEFIPLEKAILQIFQVEGVNATNEMFTALSNQVLDVASQIGKPAEEVGASIALGIGRGFSEQESIDVSEIAGNLSVALGEDLTASTKGITAGLNGFGIAVEDANRVAGVLFQTVAKSGVPMAQLAQQLGNIAPAAQNAGISLEDVAAAVATMVQSGISAAESTTQIRTAITELSRETSDGGKVFKAISGQTFPDFIKSGKTLQQAFELINAASQKSGFSVQELTGNYNTANAVIATTGAATERYTQNLADNEKGTEAMAAALDAANQGVFRQFQKAVNDIRVGVGRLGVAFRPLIQAIVAEVIPIFDAVGCKINQFALWIQTVDFTPLVNGIHWLVQQFKVIGPLFTALFGLLAGLNWQQIGDAIKVALVPVVAVIVAVRVSIQALTQVIQFITPAVQVLVDIVSYLAVPLAAVAGLFAAAGVAVLALSVGLYAGYKVFKLVNIAILAVRGAMILLNAAFAASPIGATILVLAALSAAFIYAWKNSEQFRNIVVASFNAVKDAVVTGVEWMIKAYLMFPKAVLTGFKAILDGLGHLPKWLGGGAFDSAASAVQGLLNGLDAISQGITNVANAARNADWEIRNMLSSTERAAEAAAQAGLWFGNAETDKALEAALNGGGGAGPKPPKIPSPNTSGLGDLLNPNNAKKAAAAAAKNVKDVLSGLFKSVQDLAKNISEKSVDSIESGFDSVLEKYNEAIATAAAAGNATVVKRLRESLKDIKKFEGQLLKLAGKRDIVTDKLKLAKDALKSLKDESNSFEASMKAAFINIGSVAEASAGIGVTFRGIRNNLRDAIETTTLFNSAIKDLQSLGLNEASLRQLADAGPAALDQARRLASSGAAGVAEINALQAELDKLATRNADNLADDFYNAGIAAANGLVKGLQSQQAAIIKEMDKIGDAMVASIKKKLKIHSPSQVFDEIGQQVPAGAAVGVRRGIPELVKAVQAMSAASANAGSNFGPGAVQVNGVSDPAAAQRAGILAGAAIAKTLEQRRTAQRLAGV